jgi:hypothetical protein
MEMWIVKILKDNGDSLRKMIEVDQTFKARFHCSMD